MAITTGFALTVDPSIVGDARHRLVELLTPYLTFCVRVYTDKPETFDAVLDSVDESHVTVRRWPKGEGDPQDPPLALTWCQQDAAGYAEIRRVHVY